jgi:hypothetical protein
MRRPSSILVLLVVAACRSNEPVVTDPPLEPPAGAVRIAPKVATYAPGALVELEVRNDSTIAATGKHCARFLEVLVGGDAWGRVNGYDGSCLTFSSIWTVPARDMRLALAQLPANLEPGTYRTVHEVYFNPDTDTRTRAPLTYYSRTFTVRR